MRTHVVAKTLVLNQHGEVLLMRRSYDDDHRPGGPDLPGGSVDLDKGEDIMAGAAREVRQEAGLEVGRMALLWTADPEVCEDQSGSRKQLIRILFAALVEGPADVRESAEHVTGESRFLPLEQARQELDGTTSWGAGIRHVAEYHLIDDLLEERAA